MDLVPCDENARQELVEMLFRMRPDGTIDQKSAHYVAKTFPNILLDVARLLTEQATKSARQNCDQATAIRQQLKPFFMFSFLLGKAPQVSSLMYNYFENSSFQPLPEDLFQQSVDDTIVYAYQGFSDELVREILITYIKYLAFNPKWFSAVWNWSELGRMVALHNNFDIRYLAACCLSVITKPTRHQHMSIMHDIIKDPELLIDLQIKYHNIFDNTFKPLIETKTERADDFIRNVGQSTTGYSFCSESLAKVTNILLLKRDIDLDSSQLVGPKIKQTISEYIPVASLNDTISKIAYAASINKPCVIRGAPGSGKTAILDYIAAHTNRLNPPDYVKVQISDQIDSKLLIGSYVCTEIPGQFEWQPGPLTQAMAYGSWIMFEDIDSAPSEMAQVIHSVVENGNLSCVSCCPIKMDSPHPDFRIFFTQRSRKAQTMEPLKLGFGFVERLCDIVDIPELDDDDLREILEERYNFGSLSHTIIQIYRSAEKALGEIAHVHATRVITLRDLFKLCYRIHSRGIQVKDGKYPASFLDELFLDSLDCFLLFLHHEELILVARELGQILNKPTNEVDTILTQRKPEIREESNAFSIGRVHLDASNESSSIPINGRATLAHTKQSLKLMESISLCIKHREPVLLVGETGVGKTTIVQHLADLMNTRLIVMNLSQQSDSSDLLGNYRPVEMREIIKPLNDKFIDLFKQTFNADANEHFLKTVETKYISSKRCKEWLVYLKLLRCLCGRGIDRRLSKANLEQWTDLMNKARKLSKRLSEDSSSPMALAYTHGSLLRAVRKGRWILLDEINLAEPDVLQCLLLILDSMKKSHIYLHTGDENESPIPIHPNFRIFACMNPSTDVGKRDLASGTRGRFTEFFVNDISEISDLRLIIESYVRTCLKPAQIEKIAHFYQEIRARSNTYSDISGNCPVYSLRTLCRSLVMCANNGCQSMARSLYESLKVTFLQQLNDASVVQVLKLIEHTVFKGTLLSTIVESNIPMPQDNHQYVQVEDFWIQTSSQKKIVDENFILTPSVKKNLERLCRIIFLGQRKLPILIQGNTSVGKTSLIKYLAKLTGNLCVRINNHEHTDLQEYLGRYVLNEAGELEFREGLLVTAMRRGYWVILDELNLAPSELLEALNRLLDDNRELFLTETSETIKAHSKFMLFATQNPPEEYAGRKLLSRAFRNRFIELHFDEIPLNELEVILHKRCQMAPQHSKKIVSVMRELQLYRRESGCFHGKDSFITMRDIFRWGARYSAFKNCFKEGEFYDFDQFIANQGLIILEGRVRTFNEADIVKSIIEKHFKRRLSREKIYDYDIPANVVANPFFRHIHLTPEFKRLFVQLFEALKYGEPVLLCGQTGCGKTTACQLYAAIKQYNILIYNCHLNTESSDFVGDVRPTRENGNQIFPWIDGLLVQAMKDGSIFLMDEISLADDAVLERINSVLEPERTITLTERNGEEIRADDSFRLVATMNPGGDYGKKELSRALRNRFTEIYCHNTTLIDQIAGIIEKSLLPALLKPNIAPKLITVMKRFLSEYYQGQEVISVRDILNWVKFLNKTAFITKPNRFSIQESILEGAQLVFFDQFGTCGHHFANSSAEAKSELHTCLVNLINSKVGKKPIFPDTTSKVLTMSKDSVTFSKYCVPKGTKRIEEVKSFIRESPVVESNLIKLVRAMQLDRPILLEGSPGSGKTSIVIALAKLTGNKLVRINLSEQTDISDLFGSDLPDQSEGDDDAPIFRWHDGPMLRAIKRSDWILLDEMNLASQSVLEGLNACFDHRGEIFIPELNKKFSVDRSTTRIFACQNPHNQGASRKGLPRSFVNRFTSIFMESHSPADLSKILSTLYPNISADNVAKMIAFNEEVCSLEQMRGYEFNLRDLIYWCDLITKYQQDLEPKDSNMDGADRFVQFVYLDRVRSINDKSELYELYEKIFGTQVYEPVFRDLRLGEFSFMMARSILPRKTRIPPQLSDLCILKYQMPYMESLAKAIEFKKMPILIGDTGVGKRSMVKILAGLTGNELNVVGANRDMDTVELLGSYEQRSLQREIVDLVDDASSFVSSLMNSTSLISATNSAQLCKHIWSTLYATSIRDLKLSQSEMMDAYRFQLSQMEELIERIQPLSVSSTETMCKTIKTKIFNLKSKFLYYSESMYSSGNFEWIDSALIRAIRLGNWLMIENANLLNPATLDRLNSLVEPNGSISLNEKGSGPDGIEDLVPNPNFRLILTMDPENGELSRAMRNRGTEIYVRTRFYFEDFLMLLNQNGFEPEEQKACMTYCIMQTSYDVHFKVTGEEAMIDGSLLGYFGLNYLTTLAHQIRRGVMVDKILADLLISLYSQKGFPEANESIVQFVAEKMDEYRKKFVVNLDDDRYKWCHFRHDLPSMTGGDAMLSMISRESRLFFEVSDPLATGLLKMDELIENLDIVNTCTSVKIFLEFSTHGDFLHRKNFVKETFNKYANMVHIVNSQVDSLHRDCMLLINDLMPRSDLIPVSEMYVDTRNSPDIQYYLQSLDQKATLEREDMQNRWLLSLHRITIQMIIDLIEERSFVGANETGRISLWMLGERVRTGEMLAEDLIRPQAGVAIHIYDLLNGLLQVVSHRCFENASVTKMLARLFWLGYFTCKLKRAFSKAELIAICNQIPMLWALTYQKVIVPIIKDCELADLTYRDTKFSVRIKHICDFLGVSMSKPSGIERSYYKKVLNIHATISKRCESVSREIDKFFTTIVARYTVKSESLTIELSEKPRAITCNEATLAASGVVWSNSIYMSPLYMLEDKLIAIERLEDGPEGLEQARLALADVKAILAERRHDYGIHQNWVIKGNEYLNKCLNVNRRRNSLDQFASIWQVKFIQTAFSNLLPTMSEPRQFRNSFQDLIRLINGIIVSPRYYATVNKFLLELEDRRKTNAVNSEGDKENLIRLLRTPRQNVDMYSAFLVDHLLENIVLDNQVVGWTKLRVTTCNLSSSAPLVPEYSPIISLAGSYCLDITHLKLNSYQNSNPQLDLLPVYLWRSYAQIKQDTLKDVHDMMLATNLIHLRSQSEERQTLVGPYQCDNSPNCSCIDSYIQLRNPKKYNNIIKTIGKKSDQEDVVVIRKALKLIYFGFYNILEFAPIFTLDPSLRSREKLEVYKSELAHIKLDLHQRNTLYYWKTGENLRLVDIAPEDSKSYPFSTRVLIERRAKLEQSISKLRRDHTNRPKTDDGSQYYELRKEVEICISRYTSSINSLISELITYVKSKKIETRAAKLQNLTTRCRMLIRSLEKSISLLRSDYVLYNDLTTNFLVGMCFILQGMRRLYSRMEQKMQLHSIGFAHCLVDKFSQDMIEVFSFNNFTVGNLESVNSKRRLYSVLADVCPKDQVNSIQSILLRSILLQLNHHIIITPSDIRRCIPIVHSIADKFHSAWLDRKEYLEEQRKKQEEIYQYKTSRTTLGTEISLEHQEFIDICTKFPTYDHVFQEHSTMLPMAADKENLDTEERINNLHRSVDLSMCIDVCKAHYKFMKEASLNLLGQHDANVQPETRTIEMNQLVGLEAEILYTITRHCSPCLDRRFDSLSLECHLLQANELTKVIRQAQTDKYQLGSLKNSIEILDEEMFDIYHSANAYEALKFQDFVIRVDNKINSLRSQSDMAYESHATLLSTLKLTSRISSFLLTDPLMKFVTGAHTLLEKLEEWNKGVPRTSRMTDEVEELIELIKSWRELEVKSWRGSLHRVKRKFIDDTLCDLWFTLYEAFHDPIKLTTKYLITHGHVDEDFQMTANTEPVYLYQGFVSLIKEFFENATLGDYQVRLDLVFSFAIQTRFASLYEQSRSVSTKVQQVDEFKIDYEKLTTYVYNIFRQYQGLMEPLKEILQGEEAALSAQLNEEIRIVAWQGRTLWDIRNNFRISHRKLNKVMSKYLEVLRRQPPGIKPRGYETEKQHEVGLSSDLSSSKLLDIFSITHKHLQDVELPSAESRGPACLERAPIVAKKLKSLLYQAHDSASQRFTNVLMSIEKMADDNAGSIEAFYSHKVHELVLKPEDTREEKAEKLKLCRQMYHNKKYSMQAIFKNLQNNGVSYQRGMNNQYLLDENILSLEPLRGMIQHQSRSVLAAASELVDNSLIISCNAMYHEIITKNQVLLAQTCGGDLAGDQMERIQGYAYDMVLDIITHNRNVAMVYRHFICIQAAATRLRAMQEHRKSGEIIIYNFGRVHSTIKLFNELVSRVVSAISKLDLLMKCYETTSGLASVEDGAESVVLCPNYKSERTVLRDKIMDIDERNSLITKEQFDHIQQHVETVRREISHVSCELRDKLNHTIKNYLYCQDDIVELRDLSNKFISALGHLLPADQAGEINTGPTTILGSFKSLLAEAEERLVPLIDNDYLKGGLRQIDILDHPNSAKLEIRMCKLLKQIKLATQDIYKDQIEFSTATHSSETSKRKLKPFNHIDSSKIRDLLRPSQVAKHTADCFMTLNIEEQCTDIRTIVSALAPILAIYTKNIACYINVILSGLHLKLSTANKLIPFFTDLVINGFGLPVKIDELEGGGQEKSSHQTGEENTGFGEGQGDTDASKKLEFESQLDDLKKGEDENVDDTNNGKEVGSEPIEAHDDGIEMTDDIDAKAEGAKNGERDEDRELGSDEDEEGLEELDKELDRVENDEGYLDQNLWDEDEDEPKGDDDEEDLRKSVADTSIKMEIEEASMKAKEQDLRQAPMGAKEESANGSDAEESSNEGDDEDATDETRVKQENGDDNENDISGLEAPDVSMEEEFDPVNEAKQAERQDDGQMDDIESIESFHSGIDTADDAKVDEEDGLPEGGVDENESEPMSYNEDADSREADPDISSLIENSELDFQLERQANAAQQDTTINKKGSGGEEEKQSNEGCQQGEGDFENKEDNEHENVAEGKDGSSEEIEDKLESQEVANKRTLSDRSSTDLSSIKRQKIQDADDAEADKVGDSHGDVDKDENTSYKHTSSGADNDLEVIDLISDSDDGILNGSEDDKPSIEESGQLTTSKPKGSKEIGDKVPLKERHQPEGSSYNTNLGLLKYIMHNAASANKENENADLMERIDNELNRKSTMEHESLDADNLTTLWLDCTKNTSHLVNELCQQLQIVLQPTKMSKYKGDYKSGKRLNMRKVISYIASHYRKDKIWLRRTKLCKRTYNISLAVDNSSSMAENNCRQMTYQSLALLAKSLSLIEAGSLSVVSFGEQVKCIHEFGQPYMDAIGAQWLRDLRFNESRTSYVKALKYSCESFAKQAQLTHSQLDSQTSVNQLLIIISDGRNVTSEEEDLKHYLRQLKSLGVLTLFVIIDDLEKNEGKSIVDTKRAVMIGGQMQVQEYMDFFPFPFYVLLRQIETMPSILGDALRQWFELVSNSI